MKTPHLDREIKELEKQSVFTSFSDWERERLEEFEKIKSKMELKLYEVYFEPVWTVPYGLIVLAKSKNEAMEIANKTIQHTKPTYAKLITMKKSKVVFYESGDY